MSMPKPDWRYAITRLGETSTWNAIAIVLGTAGYHAAGPGWDKFVLSATVLAGVIAMWLPQIGQPITTDIGAARKDAGQSLLSQAQPVNPAPGGIPVSKGTLS